MLCYALNGRNNTPNHNNTSDRAPADAAKDKEAITLLNRYDKLRFELAQIERSLAKSASEYGRRRGIWGMNKDHMRNYVQQKK